MAVNLTVAELSEWWHRSSGGHAVAATGTPGAAASANTGADDQKDTPLTQLRLTATPSIHRGSVITERSSNSAIFLDVWPMSNLTRLLEPSAGSRTTRSRIHHNSGRNSNPKPDQVVKQGSASDTASYNQAR